MERKNYQTQITYLKIPSNLSYKETIDTLSLGNIDTLDLCDKIANFIEVEGAFNINSTSVVSWSAQLSTLRGNQYYMIIQITVITILITPTLKTLLFLAKRFQPRNH